MDVKIQRQFDLPESLLVSLQEECNFVPISKQKLRTFKPLIFDKLGGSRIGLTDPFFQTTLKTSEKLSTTSVSSKDLIPLSNNLLLDNRYFNPQMNNWQDVASSFEWNTLLNTAGSFQGNPPPNTAGSFQGNPPPNTAGSFQGNPLPFPPNPFDHGVDDYPLLSTDMYRGAYDISPHSQIHNINDWSEQNYTQNEYKRW
jgi:hypothetical protein